MDQFIEDNYALMREWFKCALDIIWKIPPHMSSVSPWDALLRFEHEHSGKAVSSLTQGIGDTISMSSRCAGSDLATVDREFGARELPTLSEMRLIYGKKLKKIIRRGKIQDEDEYYLVREARDAVGNSHIVLQIDKMVDEFERKLG
jgi:hypothetical protein